jgi:hypothetical protein
MAAAVLTGCGRGGEAPAEPAADSGASQAAEAPDEAPEVAEAEAPSCDFDTVGDKEWPIRICDGFDDNARGWTEEKDSSDIASYDIRVEGSKYKVDYVGTAHSGYTSGGFLWVPIANSQDFALSVSGEMDSNNKLIGWGIVFRGSQGELYLFRIAKDGRYDLEISESGTRSQLIDWKAHNAINQEGSNRLGLVVEGSSADLFANGQYLESFSEADLSGDLIALAVFGQEGVQVDFAFDDLVIQSP